MARAAVARNAPATAARRYQLFLARMDMATSEWSGRIAYNNVLYGYTIPSSNVLAVGYYSDRITSDPAARARHRHAGRCEPERRYFRRLVAVPNGSRRRQS